MEFATGYADIVLLTVFNSANQQALDAVHQWLEWTKTMNGKTKKCKATGMEGRAGDPELTVQPERKSRNHRPSLPMMSPANHAGPSWYAGITVWYPLCMRPHTPIIEGT